MTLLVRTPNRAGEPAVIAQVERELAPLLRGAREDRASHNATSLRYWNIWAARHDSNAYHGRTKAYLTTGRRVIENWVAMLKRAAFPVSGKWFAATARTQQSEDRAPTVEALLRRQIMEYMAVRRKAGPLLRGLVILGTQPVDIGWRVAARDVPTIEEIAAAGGNGRSRSRMQETVKRVVEYLGPTFRPVDFFRWYVWPTTVNDIADLDLVFEDFLQDPEALERLSQTAIQPGREKGKDGLGYHIDPTQWAKAKLLVPSADGPQDVRHEQRVRLQARGFNTPNSKSGIGSRALDCEKGYWHVALDGDDAPTWYEFIVAGDNIPLRVRQVSQGLIGSPSYLAPKFVEVWEEFYGYGLPAAFDSSHYFLNDIFNQGGDALTWSLNPIAAVDPDAVQDHTTLQMKPGAKWLVRLPRQSVAWMEPPKESGVVALQAVSQLVGLINDVGGVQPFAPGGKTSGKGRAVNTLGGLQILASEGQLQAADVVQGLEDLLFNPMLRRMYDLNVHCLDEAVLLNVEGVRGAALIETNVTRANLIGEFDLAWQASAYQYNAEVRAQQMIGFSQMIARIPPQVLAQDNTRVRIGALLRMIYEDGLMLPNAERIFQDVEPVRAIAPDLENDLFRQGHGEEITVSPADKDEEHIAVHGQLAMDHSMDPTLAVLVMKHIQQHQLAVQVKALMAQQQAMGMLGPGGPGGPGMGPGVDMPPPNDRLALPDAPGRPMQTASMDDVARRMPRPGGQNPGGMPGVV